MHTQYVLKTFFYRDMAPKGPRGSQSEPSRFTCVYTHEPKSLLYIQIWGIATILSAEGRKYGNKMLNWSQSWGKKMVHNKWKI